METSEPMLPFGEVLEAVERLTLDEQQELTEVVRRRLAENARKQMARDVLEARTSHATGACEIVTVDELMGEILS